MSHSTTQVQAITASFEALRLRSPNIGSQQLPLSPLTPLDEILEGPLLSFEDSATMNGPFAKGDQYAKPPPHTYGFPIPLPSIEDDLPELGNLTTFDDNAFTSDATVAHHPNTAQPTSCLFAPDDYAPNT